VVEGQAIGGYLHCLNSQWVLAFPVITEELRIEVQSFMLLLPVVRYSHPMSKPIT